MPTRILLRLLQVSTGTRTGDGVSEFASRCQGWTPDLCFECGTSHHNDGIETKSITQAKVHLRFNSYQSSFVLVPFPVNLWLCLPLSSCAVLDVPMPSGDAGVVECSSKPSPPAAAQVQLASPTEALPPKDEGKKKKPEKKGIANLTIQLKRWSQ